MIASVAIVTVFIALIILYSTVGDQLLQSQGIIRTLGVEAYGGDIITANGNKSVDWGKIPPGVVVNRSFWVRSKSNIDALLVVTSGEWEFWDSNGSLVSVSFNGQKFLSSPQNGSIIGRNQVVNITLTLKLESSLDLIEDIIVNDVQTFSFYITIRAHEP